MARGGGHFQARAPFPRFRLGGRNDGYERVSGAPAGRRGKNLVCLSFALISSHSRRWAYLAQFPNGDKLARGGGHFQARAPFPRFRLGGRNDGYERVSGAPTGQRKNLVSLPFPSISSHSGALAKWAPGWRGLWPLRAKAGAAGWVWVRRLDLFIDTMVGGVAGFGKGQPVIKIASCFWQAGVT